MKRVAFHQFEHKRAYVAGLFEAIDCANVGMVQRREDARFALEPSESIGIRREGRRQNLDRDLALRLGVARAIDLAHAAGTERAGDFVRAEVDAGLQGSIVE